MDSRSTVSLLASSSATKAPLTGLGAVRNTAIASLRRDAYVLYTDLYDCSGTVYEIHEGLSFPTKVVAQWYREHGRCSAAASPGGDASGGMGGGLRP